MRLALVALLALALAGQANAQPAAQAEAHFLEKIDQNCPPGALSIADARPVVESQPEVRNLEFLREMLVNSVPDIVRAAAPQLFLNDAEEQVANWSWDQEGVYTTVQHIEARTTAGRANTCLWVFGHPETSPLLAMLAYRTGSAPITQQPATGGPLYLFPMRGADLARPSLYALWRDPPLRRADPGRSNLVGYLNAEFADAGQAPALLQAQSSEAFAVERFERFCGFGAASYEAIVARGEALSSARRDEAKEGRALENFRQYAGVTNQRARAWIVEEGAHWRGYVTAATINGAPYQSCSVEALGVHGDRLGASLRARPELRQTRVDDTQGGVATGYSSRLAPRLIIVHHAPHASNENDLALSIHTMSAIMIGP